jgi:anti-sigma regulatory factor (Ser/Thr protein kinase)
VSVAITCKGPRIHVQYIDQGIEFDPVDHRAGSAGLSPVQQLRKGGLGLNMIDHYCEHFEYRRHEDRNVIDLVYDTSRTAS